MGYTLQSIVKVYSPERTFRFVQQKLFGFIHMFIHENRVLELRIEKNVHDPRIVEAPLNSGEKGIKNSNMYLCINIIYIDLYLLSNGISSTHVTISSQLT